MFNSIMIFTRIIACFILNNVGADVTYLTASSRLLLDESEVLPTNDKPCKDRIPLYYVFRDCGLIGPNSPRCAPRPQPHQMSPKLVIKKTI